jgi:hypothetical protein
MRPVVHFTSRAILHCLLVGLAASAPAVSADEQKDLLFVTLINPAERPDLFRLFELAHKEICRKLQYNCTLQYFPGARATKMVELGSADGENYRIYEYAADGQYPRHVRVEAPLFEVTLDAWGKTDAAAIHSWSELAAQSKSIIYLFGSKILEKKLKTIPNVTLIPTNSVESGLRMIAAGRATYFVTSDSRSVDSKLKQLDLNDKIVNLGTVERMDTFLYLNEKHRNIAGKFQEAIESMKKEGVLDKLRMQARDVADKSSNDR